MTSPASLTRRRLALALGWGATSLTLLSVGACGFRVRGAGLVFDFDRILVLGPGAQPTAAGPIAQPVSGGGFVERLRRELSARYKRTLAKSVEDAEVVVLITSIQPMRQVVGYSGSGRAREIELRMIVSFRIENASGRLLVPPDTIELLRNISISESDVLASADAERFQNAAMEDDLMLQILRRIAAVRRDAAPTRPTSP
ncbi:MAG: hypothetical protein EBT03_03765 [Betaproteobacteria bacterium]|nr:hypothetical protein [Betaproteobacteria bacterium]NBT75816.1 hypothetical protein [Betaproteobacteria bacterium]NCA16456.1 hypothetical protein [Betaproteobacteria bacterium]NDF04426.1 hypothetical protein [Betaproteobacteria bacterium]